MTQPEAVWGELSLTNWPTVAGVTADHDALLTRRTTLRLIDAVLTALHRKQRKQRNEQPDSKEAQV